MWRGLGIGSVVLLAGAGAALWSGAWRIPDAWNPWAAIDLAQPPNFLTGHKLQRLEDRPAACLALLAQSSLRYKPLPDRVLGQGCEFRNVVQIAGSDVSYGAGFPATCPLAVALALFERHALQPAAEAAFGQRVRAVAHYGSYACRNVNHREGGRRSQHALANAFDLAGFVLRDGRRVTVRGDWAEDGASGVFLRDLHRRSCKIFRGALGPDYNAAHHDHFHLDMGGYGICR